MVTAGVLVGPLPQVRFHDGTQLVYTAPRDTLDLRYVACREHRPACDCREAEFAEERSELRGELHRMRSLEDAIQAVARLHAPRDNVFAGRRYCATCGSLTPWPCPTVNLLAAVDWLTGHATKRGEAP